MNLKDRLAAQRCKHEQPNPFIKGMLRDNDLTPTTKESYGSIREAWEQFKKEIEEPDASADLDTLKICVWWMASHSKGRIGDKVTTSTLEYNLGRFAHIYKRYYKEGIPKDTLDEVFNYIRNDLADELGLENERYDKEVTSWPDIELAVRYIISKDGHWYKHESYRLQIVLIFLLIADGGEHLGAIVRSSSRGHREQNVALYYKDVQFYLRPASTRHAPAEIKGLLGNLRMPWKTQKRWTCMKLQRRLLQTEFDLYRPGVWSYSRVM